MSVYGKDSLKWYIFVFIANFYQGSKKKKEVVASSVWEGIQKLSSAHNDHFLILWDSCRIKQTNSTETWRSPNNHFVSILHLILVVICGFLCLQRSFLRKGKERGERNSAKGDFIKSTLSIFKCCKKQESYKYRQLIHVPLIYYI